MFLKEKCTLCGECLARCPYLAYPLEEAKKEFSRLMNGEASSVTSRCVTCAACNMFCPEGANPFDLINELQERTGTFKVAEQSLAVMSIAPTLPSQVIKGKAGKPAINLCAVGDMIPGVIEGSLFEGLTQIKGGDYFCYVGWIHVGKPGMVADHAASFVNNLAATGAKEIICYHDDCYAVLDNKVKEFGIAVPFKVTHLIEYLRDYVKEHAGRVRKLNMKIAYQQPCASRYTFEKDAILDDLFERIGVTRVARRYDGMDALCCGAAMAGMKDMPRETTEEWRMKNIMDAKEAGAEAMVFLCPMCALNLRNRAKARGVEPYMVSNLVRLALGEELALGGAGKKFE